MTIDQARQILSGPAPKTAEEIAKYKQALNIVAGSGFKPQV